MYDSVTANKSNSDETSCFPQWTMATMDQYIATDLLGSLSNNEFVLTLINYYSRYTEVVFLMKITSEIIIKAMKSFSRLGFPKSTRTDNGSQYVSSESKNFASRITFQL